MRPTQAAGKEPHLEPQVLVDDRQRQPQLVALQELHQQLEAVRAHPHQRARGAVQRGLCKGVRLQVLRQRDRLQLPDLVRARGGAAPRRVCHARAVGAQQV
jgi:hypothetical protein